MHPNDDQLDPTLIDEEDEVVADGVSSEEEEPATEEQPLASDPTVATDLGPEVVEEIERVMMVEEPEEPVAVKPKAHMIPQEWIDQPLDPSKDLWDEGSGSI